MNRVRRGDRAGFTTAPNQVVCCCCKDGRMMERRFHTNLSFEECLARLAATGWSGEPKPGRWQPTTADRDVFRKVEGNCFQLADRRMQASGPEEFYQVFQGSLREQDQGTLITGSYHSTSHGVANLPPRLLGGVLMMIVVVVIALANFLRGADDTWPLLLLGLAGAVLLTMTISRVFAFQGAGGGGHEEHVVRALRRLLEARELSSHSEV